MSTAPARPPTTTKPQMPRWLHWVVPVAVVASVYMASKFEDGGGVTAAVDYTTFYARVEQGHVERVELRGQQIVGHFEPAQTIDGKRVTRFRTAIPEQEDAALIPLLREQNVAVAVETESSSIGSTVLMYALPWVLIIGVWFWLSRRANQMLSGRGPFGGAVGGHAKRFDQHDVVDVTFDDVAGLVAAKRDLGEIIALLRDPDRFERLGGKMPRGVLLAGAPGTGKTLLARAVAGEAGVPFFSITGSEFIEMYVGVGASRVRDLFATAKKAAPAILFIDEIDAVGRSRGTGLGGGHDEREQTLNQLLAEMDGFERNDRIVVIAATNRPDVLDPALLRPGRFDRRVVVDLPASSARRAILDVHVRGKPLAPDVALDEIAKATPGFSGADLANLVNEAALQAIRREADLITARDFAAAHDKVQLGDPRETHLSPEEKHRVAVHEAGHALVAFRNDTASPVRRVSIIPRGRALGATQQSQVGDKHLHTKSELLGRLRVLLGGYAAELRLLGEASTGAENDLRQASDIAHRMVAQFGMSERLGPVFHEHRAEHPFLGARIANSGGISDATAHTIEVEACELIRGAVDDADATLERDASALQRLVAALLEHETLDGEQVAAALAEPSIRRHPPKEPLFTAVS